MFHDAVAAALGLLREHDLRRFNRVRKHLGLVYNRPLISGAMYEEAIRACAIDFSRYDAGWREHEAFPALVAAAIVHEATHAAVRSRRRVAGDAERRLQEEELCNREEWRCFERLTSAAGIPIDDEWLAGRRRYDPRWHRAYYRMAPAGHRRRRIRRMFGRGGVWGFLRRAWGPAWKEFVAEVKQTWRDEWQDSRSTDGQPRRDALGADR